MQFPRRTQARHDCRTCERGELLFTASLSLLFGLLSLPSLYGRLDRRPMTLTAFLSTRLVGELGRLRYAICAPLSLLFDASVRVALRDAVCAPVDYVWTTVRSFKRTPTKVAAPDSMPPVDTLI